MLLVCRDFYYAGIEAYYGRVVFKFLSVDHLRALLDDVGKDRKNCIKHIVVNVEFETNANLNLGDEGRHEPLHLPRASRDFDTDPLAELPSLQRAKIMVGAPHFLTMDTPRAMNEIRQIFLNAWTSKADAIEIEWFWRDHWTALRR